MTDKPTAFIEDVLLPHLDQEYKIAAMNNNTAASNYAYGAMNEFKSVALKIRDFKDFIQSRRSEWAQE